MFTCRVNNPYVKVNYKAIKKKEKKNNVSNKERTVKTEGKKILKIFLNVLFSLSKQKGARSFIDERIICPAHLLISNLRRIFGHKPV